MRENIILTSPDPWQPIQTSHWSYAVISSSVKLLQEVHTPHHTQGTQIVFDTFGCRAAIDGKCAADATQCSLELANKYYSATVRLEIGLQPLRWLWFAASG